MKKIFELTSDRSHFIKQCRQCCLSFHSGTIFTWVLVQPVVSLSFKMLVEQNYRSLVPEPWLGHAWYMWGRRIRGQVTSHSQKGGHCPARLLQLVSCHQTKALLITNSWAAKGRANEHRDGVCRAAAVQIKRSFGPVFVWGSQFSQRSGPSRDQDLKDLSRAPAAFRNKLVGETMLYSTAVDHSEWKRKFRGSLSHWIQNILYVAVLSAVVTAHLTPW